MFIIRVFVKRLLHLSFVLDLFTGTIAVGDRKFMGCKILILPKLCLNFAKIQSNLPQKKLLGNPDASPTPTALTKTPFANLLKYKNNF